MRPQLVKVKKLNPRMEEIKGNHAVHKLGYHIVIVPKFRHDVIINLVEVELKRVLTQTCMANGWILHTMETMPDHVHMFIQLPHTIAPVDAVRCLKSVSANHIFTVFPKLKGRKFWGSGFWSRGAYYATVGSVSEEAIRMYIENQKKQPKGVNSITERVQCVTERNSSHTTRV
jgi:putative transposase